MGTKAAARKKKQNPPEEIASMADVMEFIKYLQDGKHDLDIRKFIKVHMIFDGEGTKGWAHTHGMFEFFGLPDLEIRDVNPIMLMPAAGEILNHFAQYMVDGLCGRDEAESIKVGETFGPVHGTVLCTKLSSPIHPTDNEENAGHFTTPRWLVFALDPQCSHCKAGDRTHVH